MYVISTLKIVAIYFLITAALVYVHIMLPYSAKFWQGEDIDGFDA